MTENLQSQSTHNFDQLVNCFALLFLVIHLHLIKPYFHWNSTERILKYFPLGHHQLFFMCFHLVFYICFSHIPTPIYQCFTLFLSLPSGLPFTLLIKSFHGKHCIKPCCFPPIATFCRRQIIRH